MSPSWSRFTWRVSWRAIASALGNWCIWAIVALLVASQFSGIVWNTITFGEHAYYGRSPLNPVSALDGTNDEPYGDRNIVCIAQGRSYVPQQLSHVLANPKFAHTVDTTGASIHGYRVVDRGDTFLLDASVATHFTAICDRIDMTLESIQDSCDKLGYNVTRDTLRIVGDIGSNDTIEIPRALPILIMPFWDSGIHAHYAIPGWDGMACLFRLDGMYVAPSEPAGVLRAAPRQIRETKTAEWLHKPSGVWRNGWYEDGTGQRWSSDMMTTDLADPYGIQSRQFDTVTNTELDCSLSSRSVHCRDFSRNDQWGQNCLTTQDTFWFNALYISNGTHFGLFLYEGDGWRTILNKYSLGTFISNISVMALMLRWFVAMAAMLHSYLRGRAPWQTIGIGCLANSRTFNLLPLMLLPRFKMILAAFWTSGIQFEGQQRALTDAWFAVYPSIVELVLVYFSLIHFIATVSYRRVSDALFGPTVVAFAWLHLSRSWLAKEIPWLKVTTRMATSISSDQFDALQLVDLFRPSVALQLNGNASAIFYFKLVVLALNVVPLLIAEKMTKSGKKFRTWAPCEIEKTLAVRASNAGGLGVSHVYMLSACSDGRASSVRGSGSGAGGHGDRDHHSDGKVRDAPVPTGGSIVRLRKTNSRSDVVSDGDGGPPTDTIIPPTTVAPTFAQVLPASSGHRGFCVDTTSSTSTSITTTTDGKPTGAPSLGDVAARRPSPPSVATLPLPTQRPLLIGYELIRLGYVVYGDKFLITFDEWYTLTSMAPLRRVEQLWNRRISVFDVTKTASSSASGLIQYRISSTSRLCRLDDKELREIPFYNVTVGSFQ